MSLDGFSELQASRDRPMAGFSAAEQLYGLGQHGLNSAALLCRLFGDKEAAARYLRRIGDDWDEQVWGRKTYFIAAQKWAGL